MIAGDRLAIAAVEERSVVLPRITAPREVATFHLGDPRSSLLAGVARESLVVHAPAACAPGTGLLEPARDAGGVDVPA